MAGASRKFPALSDERSRSTSATIAGRCTASRARKRARISGARWMTRPYKSAIPSRSSGLGIFLLLDFIKEPNLRRGPFAIDVIHRHPEHVRYLLHRHSAEKSH